MHTVRSGVTDASASEAFIYWEQPSLTFDMDQGKPSSPNSRDPPQPRSASSSLTEKQEQHTDGNGDAALLAQFSALAGNLDQGYSSMLSQRYYPSMVPVLGFYDNFLHYNNMPPPRSASINPPWNRHTAPNSKSSTNQHNVPQAASRDSGLDSRCSPLHASDATTSRSTQGQQLSLVVSHNSSSPEVDLTEAERVAASDEKRRRNTTASARFRIKKKHRTIALERTVSDLIGRAEELEREVGDLRRENGWLKEIVMLKGTQNLANNRLALRQALTDQWDSELQAEASEGSSPEISGDEDEPPAKKGKGKQS